MFSFPEPYIVQHDDAGRGPVKNEADGGQARRVEEGIHFHEGRQNPPLQLSSLKLTVCLSVGS